MTRGITSVDDKVNVLNVLVHKAKSSFNQRNWGITLCAQGTVCTGGVGGTHAMAQLGRVGAIQVGGIDMDVWFLVDRERDVSATIHWIPNGKV